MSANSFCRKYPWVNKFGPEGKCYEKNFVNVHVVVDKHSVNYFDYLINNFLHWLNALMI